MSGRKYSTVIEFKGVFEGDQVLKQYKKVRAEMGKGGADIKLFGNVDKEISAAESTIRNIKAQIDKGFYDKSEILSYHKALEKLDLQFNKIRNDLSDVNQSKNYKTGASEIEKTKKELAELEKQQIQLKKVAMSEVSQKGSEFGLTKKEVEQIVKQTEALNDLEEAIKRVGKAKIEKARSQNNKKIMDNADAQSFLANASQGLSASDFGITNIKGARTRKGATDVRERKGKTVVGINNEKADEVFAGAYTSALTETIQKGKDANYALQLIQDTMRNSASVFREDTLLLQVLNDTLDDFNKKFRTEDMDMKEKKASVLGNMNSEGNFELSDKGKELANNPKYAESKEKENVVTEKSIELKEAETKQLENNTKLEKDLTNALENCQKAQEDNNNKTKEGADELYKMSETQKKVEKGFESWGQGIKQLFSFSSALSSVRSAIQDTFNDIQSLDKSFASIAMVTDYSVQDMWNSYGEYAQMANELGQSTQSVIEASGLYYQQGLDTKEALSLTTDTMQLATLAGLDFSEATSQMTAALRGFKMEMDEGSRVTDVYAELAAKAAADVKGIAEAMNKTASIASSAGMDFETTSAFLTQMIETTQEAPTNIGTAMKTIIARFTELKENIAGTEKSEFDDLDYNKVDKALKSVGISLKDTSGQFRDLDDVFLELSSKWDTLDRNTQRYIATTAAGSRQQSRFLAMMDNYDRTIELVNTAYDSNGKASEQFAKYSDTLEYKLNQLTNTWEQMRLSFMDSSFLKGVVDLLNKVLTKISSFDGKTITAGVVASIVAIKQVIGSLVTKGKSLIKIGVEIANTDGKKGNKVFKWIEKRIDEIKEKAEEGMEIKVDTKEAEEKLTELERRMKALNNEAEEAKTDKPESPVPENPVAADNSPSFFETTLTIEGSSDSDSKVKTFMKDAVKETDWSKAGSAAGSAFLTGLTAMLASDNPFAPIGSVMVKTLAPMITQMIAKFFALKLASVATGKAMKTAFESVGKANVYLAIISLIIGAVMSLISYLKKLKEQQEANKFENRLKVAEEMAKSSEEAAQSAKRQATETAKGAKEAEELRDRFNELNDKQALTTTEQEEYNELVAKIREQFPTVVSYYNEVTGELQVQNDLWQDIINKQKESAKNSNNNYIASQAGAAIAQQNVEDYYNAKEKAASTFIDPTFFEDYTKVEKEGDTAKLDSLKTDLINNNKDNSSETINILRRLYDEVSSEEWDSEYVTRRIKNDTNLIYVDPSIVGNSLADFNANINNLEKTFNDLDGTIAAYNQEMTDSKELIRNNLKNEYSQNYKAQNSEATDAEAALYGSKMSHFIDTSNKEIDDNYKDEYALMPAEEAKSDSNNIGMALMTKIGLGSYKAVYDAFIKLGDDAEAQSKLWDELVAAGEDGMKQIYAQVYARHYAEQQNQDFENELNNLSATERQNYNQAYDEAYKDGTTQEEVDKLKQAMQNLFDEDTIKDIVGPLEESITKAKERIKETGLQEDVYSDWSTNQMDRYSTIISDMASKIGDETAKEYGQKLIEAFSNFGLSSEEMFTALSFDWKDVNMGNLEEKKQEFVSMMESAMGESFDEDKVNQLWSNFFSIADNYNVIDISINSEADLDSLEKSVTDRITKVLDKVSGISSVITEQIENGFISFSSSAKVEAALQELGMKAEKYLTYKDNGQINLNTEQLKNDLLNDEGLAADHLLEQARAETQEKIDQLQIQYDILLALSGQIDGQVALQKQIINSNAQLYKTYELMYAMGLIPGQKKDSSSFLAPLTDTTESAQLNKSLDTIRERIESAQKFLDNDLVKGSAFYDTLVGKANAGKLELYNTLNEAERKGIENKNKNAAASSKAADATDKLAEAEKKLQEALYGTDNYKNAVDHLANYTNYLKELTKAADEAKEKLDDLDGAAAGEALNDFMNNSRKENMVREAENQVIQKSIDNYKQILQENYSQYIKEYDGVLMWNAEVVDAKINDKVKDYILNTVEEINKLEDQIDQNNDAIKKREKEYTELRKKALDDRVKLEDEVMKVLKDKYDKEIDETKKKYDALKEADDDYISALEESIKKQRDLRDRSNQYEELAQKERKLALMSRDTTGTRQKDRLSLEKEVKDSRQELLDKEVDNIIESMKELYEKQQEVHETEIEYMEAMKENGVLLQEANAIIDSFNSREDMLAWFFENNQELADMSVAATEKYKMELEDMYDAAGLYYEMQKSSIEDLTSYTEEEISQTITNVGETLTMEAERSYTEMKENVEKEVEEAKKAVQDAMQAVADAANALKSAADSWSGGGGGDFNSNVGDDPNASTALKYGLNNVQAIEAYNKAHPEAKLNTDSILSSPSVQSTRKTTTTTSKNPTKTFIGPINKGPDYKEAYKYLKKLAEEEGRFGTGKNSGLTFQIPGFSKTITLYNDTDKKKFRDYMDTKGLTYQTEIPSSKSSTTKKFAKGGLVDFTGPAWVDGTKTEPEAFLNSEDTKRIGEAAKLLSTIPALNSTNVADNAVSTNIGDTNVEIHINVDSISSDYDVDQLANRIKQDIVNSSKPIGSPVIIRR